jgi:putative ABC transport system permease protein
MDSLFTDVRYGLRMLVRTPGLSAVAILTIALGVGLTTHTFSVVYGAAIRGLDLDGGAILVSISQDIPSEETRGGGIPILDLVDFREQQTAFRGLAGYAQLSVNLADEASPPERVQGARVSANLFAQVDAVPVLGRVFNATEDAGTGELVIILGYAVWENRYGGDPNIVGQRIQANGQSTTVVGVMPEGFRFPLLHDVWLPLGVNPVLATRGASRVGVVGRLNQDVSLEQAGVQLGGIARRLADQYPETNEGVGVWIQPYEDSVLPADIMNVLWVMLAAVFAVLVIASFNVANLLLARAAIRSKEVAIRSALGADRARLIRQLLLEASLLVVLGGVGGILLAYIGVDAFNRVLVDLEIPYWVDIRLDAPAIGFSIGITAFASLLAGTIPAIRASGGKIHEIIQDQSRGSSSFRLGRFSAALVIGEIALSCGLLVGAGMMIKTVMNLRSLDLGFDSEQLFTARFRLVDTDYPDDESRRRFFDRLLEDLRSAPSAEAVGLTMDLPAQGSGETRVALEGIAYADPRDRPLSNFSSISPGYLDALGIGVLEGRGFGAEDRNDAVAIVIVNESFARKHFGDVSPLGRRFRRDETLPWMTVIGLIPDIYVGGGDAGLGSGDVIPDQFFTPLAQREGARAVNMVVRTRDAPGAFALESRSIVDGIDADLPLFNVWTMDEAVESATWPFAIFGTLFTIFGAAALFLAGVGLYGVMAFSVNSRIQEMGIRMALGATHRDVIALVLSKGMKQLGIGAAIGLVLGALMAQPMTAVFFDVSPSDPTVYASIIVTLGLAGLFACLIPARRATRVELVEALRPD